MLTQKRKGKRKGCLVFYIWRHCPFTLYVHFSTLHTIVYFVLKVMIGIGLYANHAKERYFKTTNASFISPTPATQIIEDFTTTCKMVFSIVMLFRNFSQHDHLS